MRSKFDGSSNLIISHTRPTDAGSYRYGKVSKIKKKNFPSEIRVVIRNFWLLIENCLEMDFK